MSRPFARSRAPGRPPRVYSRAAHSRRARRRPDSLAEGEVLGINEGSPYGYHLAQRWGCEVRFSHDRAESAPVRLWRRALRRLLGFDVVHVARNAARLRDCDVVRTHTECQTLAVLALRKWHGDGPRVVGQSVWLFDDWPRLGILRRTLYRWLLREADVLTTLSPANLAVARALLPQVRCEALRFGIGSATPLPARPVRAPDTPCRLVAAGNDRDRDWATLLAAVGGDPRFALTIVSQRVSPRLLDGLANVRLASPRDNAALFALYADADIAVVPLRPNLHASGCTAIQEAALLDLPAACTRTGGLEAYFEEGVERYVRRHVELSRDALGRAG
jgi:hypothetical protein